MPGQKHRAGDSEGPKAVETLAATPARVADGLLPVGVAARVPASSPGAAATSPRWAVGGVACGIPSRVQTGQAYIVEPVGPNPKGDLVDLHEMGNHWHLVPAGRRPTASSRACQHTECRKVLCGILLMLYTGIRWEFPPGAGLRVGDDLLATAAGLE